MKTVCRMPKNHSTEYMDRYVVYYTCISCASAVNGYARVSGFTDYSAASGSDEYGIPMECESGGTISIPSEGYLSFRIPSEGMIQNNRGLCFVFESDSEEPLKVTVNDVLLDNSFRKPSLLFFDQMSGGRVPFTVSSAEYLSMIKSKENGTVSFDIDNTDEHGYLLLYCGSAERELVGNDKCSLFVPKTNYCIDEPIVYTYRNLFSKYDSNTFMIDMLLYYEGDRPGIDRSRDYKTLLYHGIRCPFSATYSMPNDGARNFYSRMTGNYTLRMMQLYIDLCPLQAFTISEGHLRSELKAPPNGMLYFINVKRLPASLIISAEDPEMISAIYFKCDSPLIGLIEQMLCLIPDVAETFFDLRNSQPASERLLQSLVYQILFTAYIKHIHEMQLPSGHFPSPSVSDQIVAFINHNLSRKLNIRMLTEVFHMSESNLSHTFKNQKGISVQRYIYNAKINRAKQWLLNTDFTVTEIASMLNYSDIYSFSHSFRQLVGLSPLEYRKLNKIQSGNFEEKSDN